MSTSVDNGWLVLAALEMRFVILVTNCQFNLHTLSFQPLNLLFVFIVSNHFITDAVRCICTAYIELSLSIAIFYVVGQSQAPITTSLLLNSKNHYTSPWKKSTHTPQKPQWPEAKHIWMYDDWCDHGHAGAVRWCGINTPPIHLKKLATGGNLRKKRSVYCTIQYNVTYIIWLYYKLNINIPIH